MGLNKRIENMILFLESELFFDKSGGVYAWVEKESHAKSFIYNEISGYFLTLTAFLYENKYISQKSNLFKQALNTVNWLLENKTENNISFIDRVTNSEKGDKTFFFDDSIISTGLLNFSMVIDNQKLKLASLELIKKQFTYWKSSENFNAVKDLKGKVLDNPSSWSTVYGPHHLKTLIPLLKAYSITHDNDYIDKANQLIESSFSQFLYEDILFSEDRAIHMHSLLYALEGLVYYYSLYPNVKLKSIILKNFKFVQDNTNRGIVPRYIKNNILNVNERMDVFFQYLRLSKILASLQLITPIDNEEIIFNHCDKFYDGHVYSFGKMSNGEPIHDLTSWVNFIALQYLISSENDKLPLLKFLI